MEHIAIMRKSWGLTQKILTGQKKIESRWYKIKYAPWDKIKSGEIVYFKDSGEPITIKTEVDKVIQFSNLTPEKVKEILYKYGQVDGLDIDKTPEFFEIFKDKKYCILIFLKNPQKIKPFKINKSGFGAMSAWISVDDINKIKRRVFINKTRPCPTFNFCYLKRSFKSSAKLKVVILTFAIQNKVLNLCRRQKF